MDFIRSVESECLDVLFKCFSLSLETNTRKWFFGLPNNSINSPNGCRDTFFSRWLERRDSRFLLKALTNMRRNENEIVTLSHLEVTRRDHVSWPTMKTMILMIMMINMSTEISPSDASSSPSQPITLNQQGLLGDGGPTYYKVH
jgi:hypothetical protein